MSLKKCSCGGYYTDSKQVQKVIGSCIERNEPIMVVVECPICREKTITGGEPDVDFETGRPCVLVFGDSYQPKRDKDLPVYKNILLEECNEEESEFSTFSRSKNDIVYLKIP